jgi:hypothetical protein
MTKVGVLVGGNGHDHNDIPQGVGRGRHINRKQDPDGRRFSMCHNERDPASGPCASGKEPLSRPGNQQSEEGSE